MKQNSRTEIGNLRLADVVCIARGMSKATKTRGTCNDVYLGPCDIL